MGASRAHFGARRGPTRPIREALGLSYISTCTMLNAPAYKKQSLRQKSKNMGRFGRFWASFGDTGGEGVRARPPFVAISSVRSDLRRSRSVS